MIKLYGKLNRYRGSKNKLLGIAGMWGLALALLLPTYFIRPDILGITALWQFLILAILSVPAFLSMYKWFWGSAVFPQKYDTRDEVARGDLLPFAKHYADSVTGVTYNEHLTDTVSIIKWKESAHLVVCSFRYSLGYLLLSLAAFSPAGVLLAFRGILVADIYREEYKAGRDHFKATGKGDYNILHRAEIRIGEGDAKFLIAFAILSFIQAALMLGGVI